MTQFTCKVSNRSITGYHLNTFTIRISQRFSSAREFQMGNFQKYWSQNVGQDFIVLYLLAFSFKISRSTLQLYHIPVNPPPFCGSLPRKSLISRMDWVSCAGDINLPHKPTSLSSINCQSVDNCCIIINTLINLHDPIYL
jgi:hypothetical protein